MELELERFWKVVRPKRYPPRPKAAQRPKTIQIYIEAAESPHGAPCTRRIEATLSQVSDGYQGDIHFGAMREEVDIICFRWCSKPDGPVSLLECDPQHLRPGDSLVLALHVGNDGAAMPQLQSWGLLG